MTAVAEAGTVARRGRVDVAALTGLRLVAALWVVLFHWTAVPEPANARVREVFGPITGAGYLGVELFFVISGFVITLTYVEQLGPRLRLRPAGRFLWARVCRVWPAYALVTVLFGLYLVSERRRVGPGRDITFQVVQPSLDWTSWVQQLLLVQQWQRPRSDGASFVGPAWSVSAEMAAYVAFPLLALLLYRLRRLPAWLLWAAAVASLVPVSAHAFATGSPYYDWSWAARLGAGFVSGSLVCLGVRRVRRTPAVEAVARAVAVLTVVELLLVLYWVAGRPGNRYAVSVVLFPVLVGALALSSTGPARLLSTRTAVAGGRMSYSLYLVHVPLFEIYWVKQMQHQRIAPDGPYNGLLLPNLVLAAIAVGYLLWRLVEEPARVRLRGLVERRGLPVEDLPAGPPRPASPDAVAGVPAGRSS